MTNYLDVVVVVLDIVQMDLSSVMDIHSPFAHNDEIRAWMNIKIAPYLVENENTLEVELARWLDDDSAEKSMDDIEVFS